MSDPTTPTDPQDEALTPDELDEAAGGNSWGPRAEAPMVEAPRLMAAQDGDTPEAPRFISSD